MSTRCHVPGFRLCCLISPKKKGYSAALTYIPEFGAVLSDLGHFKQGEEYAAGCIAKHKAENVQNSAAVPSSSRQHQAAHRGAKQQGSQQLRKR